MATPQNWGELQCRLWGSPSAAALLEDLERLGGWRALFDPDAEEWQWCSLRIKSQFFKDFEEFGYPKTLLLRLRKQSYLERGRPDMADSCDEAIRRVYFDHRPGRSGRQPLRRGTPRLWRVERWQETSTRPQRRQRRRPIWLGD
ncbi:MAG TPA: hypothetical protein VEL76_28600 [Gemmataceae bacterium]|nr:hypothetical protein [Gemmataceae bacterium]